MSNRKLRAAPFALRIVRRSGGDAAIVYRRMDEGAKRDRLVNVSILAPLPFVAATPLIRAAVKAANDGQVRLKPGPSLPLDHDWGARLACYARISAGLRDADRLARAANAVYHASGAEAAWWLGLMDRQRGSRAVRALRILTEATQ
jgi:hypothetical protein